MTDMRAGIAPMTDRQMSIGRVFSRAFGALGAHPLAMFGIAFLFGAMPSMLLSFVTQDARSAITGSALMTVAIGAGALILTLVFTILAQGALVRATVAHSDGYDVRFGDAAMAGLRNIVPLLVVGILFGLGVGLASLFFLVPGVILYIVWSVAAPALVAERTGIFGAFGRSADLARGARWNVFAIQLVSLVIYYVIAAIAGIVLVLAHGGIQGMAAAQQAGPAVVNIVLGGVFSTLSIALTAAIQTSLYVELRDWKHGPASEALGEIFA